MRVEMGCQRMQPAALLLATTTLVLIVIIKNAPW